MTKAEVWLSSRTLYHVAPDEFLIVFSNKLNHHGDADTGGRYSKVNKTEEQAQRKQTCQLL